MSADFVELVFDIIRWFQLALQIGKGGQDPRGVRLPMFAVSGGKCPSSSTSTWSRQVAAFLHLRTLDRRSAGILIGGGIA